MNAHLPVLPIVWPLATAVLLLFCRGRVGLQRVISLVSLLGLIVAEVLFLQRMLTGEIAVYKLGAWPAPFGIVLMADRLSAVMLLLASVTALAAIWYAFGDQSLGEARERHHFHPLMQFILMGVNGAFLTGDIFNLFVWYEVMLLSSYCLITLGGGARQLRAGIPYLAVNLFGSTIFLSAVGLLYGVTGSLNMAHLSLITPGLEGTAAAVMQATGLMLMVVFGIKAAVFPLYFWLPDGYPAPPAAISAFFGGVATKVGVYSMIRVGTLVFGGQTALLGEVLMAVGALSMLIGVWGAVCQTEIRRLLSFHVVSQIGYLVFALGLFTEAGLAAAVFYMLHYTIVKCSLFLIAGVMERISGQNNLKKMGGLMETAPVLATLFFIGGLSLAGLPPWSGFFAKFVVIVAGFQERQYLYTFVAVVTGFFTLFSMMKIWHLAFWGEKKGPHERPWRLGYLSVLLLVSFSVTLAVWFKPVNNFARQAAAQLLDTQAYVRAVLGEGATATTLPAANKEAR